MIYANPGTPDALINFDARYGNYIGGEFVPPVQGRYFDNVSPVNGEVICEIPVPVPRTSSLPSTRPTPPLPTGDEPPPPNVPTCC
ncbi:EPTC-inducible aldehyde dehydrogenase [Halomonas elongata]|uniref:EPTC-inducible aldehyde dehydrogenase n=1 Tax=Halomonas elongata TaxID=2746 RepID=A0A1B8P1N5_HALEL|nr:EPTC-inducible aldehyde dehydrogenase [Halomonas elongata]